MSGKTWRPNSKIFVLGSVFPMQILYWMLGWWWAKDTLGWNVVMRGGQFLVCLVRGRRQTENRRSLSSSLSLLRLMKTHRRLEENWHCWFSSAQTAQLRKSLSWNTATLVDHRFWLFVLKKLIYWTRLMPRNSRKSKGNSQPISRSNQMILLGCATHSLKNIWYPKSGITINRRGPRWSTTLCLLSKARLPETTISCWNR